MLPKQHKKAVLCTANHSSNTFDCIIKKKNTCSCAFLMERAGLYVLFFSQHTVVQHVRSFLLHDSLLSSLIDSLLHADSSGKPWHCWRGKADPVKRDCCGHPGVLGGDRLQRSSHNHPTHLPLRSGSTQEATLQTGFLFWEIKSLLQLCVETQFSSSIHSGHSATLPCSPGLQI